MTTSEAIEHFKTGEVLRKLLGLSSGAISQWGEYPPDARQLQIERMTVGALRAEPGCLDRVLGMHKVELARARTAGGATKEVAA